MVSRLVALVARRWLAQCWMGSPLTRTPNEKVRIRMSQLTELIVKHSNQLQVVVPKGREADLSEIQHFSHREWVSDASNTS